jgi:hypothetical protein
MSLQDSKVLTTNGGQIIELKDLKVAVPAHEFAIDKIRKGMPKNVDEQIAILMEDKQYITILTDEALSDEDLKNLSATFRGVFVYDAKAHDEANINEVRTGEIVVININHGWSCLSEPSGLRFYAINQKYMSVQSHVLYYRKSGAIKKENLYRMEVSMVINKLPAAPKDKLDYLNRLLYNKPPQYRNWGSRALQYIKKHL